MAYKPGQEIRAWLLVEVPQGAEFEVAKHLYVLAARLQWQADWSIKRIDTTDLRTSREVFRGTKFEPRSELNLFIAVKARDQTALHNALTQISEVLSKGGVTDPEGRVVTSSAAWDW